MMKFSEAIRLGSLIVKPYRTRIYYHDGSGCAIGMALEAIGARCADGDPGSNEDENARRALAAWPWLERCSQGSSVYNHVVNRFDTQNQSAEEIAAWIETIEPKGDTNGKHDEGTDLDLSSALVAQDAQ